MKAEWIKELDKIIDEAGLVVTFSINCHSGIASYLRPGHQCGCKRCLTERGEQWTEETEAQAAIDSKEAQAAFKAHLFPMRGSGL